MSTTSNVIAGRDLRAGHTIIWNDAPCLVLEHSFNKTAMRGGIVKCKIKNLNNKDITIEDFSSKKLKRAIINKVDLCFSYSDREYIYLINKETYEEVRLDKKEYEWECNFLEEGVDITVSMYEEHIIMINLPDSVSLTIDQLIEDNASSEHKKAITSSGFVVLVPKFLKSTDIISVSTTDGKYKSR